jgi:hypothetical protein
MKKIFVLFFVIFEFSMTLSSQKIKDFHFYIEAGAFNRINTPVSVDITQFPKNDSMSYQLFEKVNGHLIQKPCQVEQSYTPVLWFIMDGITERGKEREYFLNINAKNTYQNNISAKVTSDEIILKKGSSEILHYRKAVMYPPDNVDTVYKRSGFIHPLITPSGNVLTRVNPPDHYHHVGLWNPWTRVKIGDHVTDFWNLYEKQGTVRFAGVNSIVNGSVFGGFTVKQDHIDFQGKKPEELAINEIWDVRAWNTDPLSGSNSYLIDLTTFLSVAGCSPITLQAYRYGGGIGIRANEEWTNDNSTVLTSEGKTRLDADGTRARWTDLNGTFKNNGQSGIVFFSHTSNREYPEPMRVWPADANNGRGDVYFEFCPIRFKDWVLIPGNVYKLKYRLLIYDGKIDKDTSERLWNDFAFPPVVRIISK